MSPSELPRIHQHHSNTKWSELEFPRIYRTNIVTCLSSWRCRLDNYVIAWRRLDNYVITWQRVTDVISIISKVTAACWANIIIIIIFIFIIITTINWWGFGCGCHGNNVVVMRVTSVIQASVNEAVAIVTTVNKPTARLDPATTQTDRQDPLYKHKSHCRQVSGKVVRSPRSIGGARLKNWGYSLPFRDVPDIRLAGYPTIFSNPVLPKRYQVPDISAG